MSSLEYCAECGNPTGGAGELEDSRMMMGQPYCEDCWIPCMEQAIDDLESKVEGQRHSIQSLESQLAESRAENSAEVERLRAFRAAVLGWRIHNHPEWFCRRTAETVADYGRAGEEQTIQ